MTHEPALHALILAAGASRRFGSPKQLQAVLFDELAMPIKEFSNSI